MSVDAVAAPPSWNKFFITRFANSYLFHLLAIATPPSISSRVRNVKRDFIINYK